jgi:hypothetical protein
MHLCSLKSAYFAVTTALTLSIIGGGIAIIILDRNSNNVIWAQQLIGMIVTLWVPSPAENLREILAENINRHHSHDHLEHNIPNDNVQNVIIHTGDDIPTV